MKEKFFVSICSALSLFAGTIASAATAPLHDISYRNELQHAIDRGVSWLLANQNSNGWWSTPDQPAVTALALTAIQADPAERRRQDLSVAKGYKYILESVHSDGSIHRTNLPTYNTSICMMALLAAGKSEYEPVILKAREFLVGLQGDFGEKGKIDSPFDGGVGYGSKYEHSDMGNTVHALEALHYSKRLLEDKNLANAKDLNWAAAIHFLESCQNLPGVNKEPWASGDPQNKGGFVYYPGMSMAGTVTNAEGKVALRSYGSISYSGLLSYIYADLKKDDPRVQAVFDWLKKNYTTDENPGMGPQGLYYYLHTMTKALSAYGAEDLSLPNGRKADWRREVGAKLLNTQQKDGSWINDNARWWEKDAALITSYAVLSLSRIHAGL